MMGRDAIYRDNETASFGYFPGKTNTTQAAEKAEMVNTSIIMEIEM